MTTIPDRLYDDFFYKLLDNTVSLCKNTLKYNVKLILNMPFIFNKTNEPYKITTRLYKFKKRHKHKFIINRCEDEGPITKILPTLSIPYIKPTDIIIVMDDDISYRRNFIKYLYNSYVTNPNAIHCYGESRIQGFAGYCASKKIFSHLLDSKSPKSCYLLDDNFIGMVFKKLNVPLVAVKYDNILGWDSSFDKKKTDRHPLWAELGKNRSLEMIKKCEAEII